MSSEEKTWNRVISLIIKPYLKDFVSIYALTTIRNISLYQLNKNCSNQDQKRRHLDFSWSSLKQCSFWNGFYNEQIFVNIMIPSVILVIIWVCMFCLFFLWFGGSVSYYSLGWWSALFFCIGFCLRDWIILDLGSIIFKSWCSWTDYFTKKQNNGQFAFKSGIFYVSLVFAAIKN